jgi:peptide-methionine (S)-S-oxide reductase
VREKKSDMNFITIIASILILSQVDACQAAQASTPTEERLLDPIVVSPEKDLSEYNKAYFASGCFWCVEAIFESVEGVAEAVSGYAGGSADDANYRAVSSGATEHAEAVEVYYDSTVVDFPTLLQVFYGSHDPTTLNRQGNDRGPQYRSAVFYKNEKEQEITVSYQKQLNESGIFQKQIVTQIVPLDVFYRAEDYHQDFERRNPNQGYVRAVSVPRLNKFKKKFPELLKKGAELH